MAWPESALDVIGPRLAAALPGYEQERRPLRIEDPESSMGLYVVDWQPTEGSYEIGGEEPALGRYMYRIQLLVKNASEEEARAQYSVDTKIVRAVLYRDPDLLLGLAGLSEDLLGRRERFQKARVMNQRYMNNEVSGRYVCLSSTTLAIQTEISPIA